MNRLLFVVAAFLCIALSCTAQKNELQCGGGRCAVTLDAPTNEDQKKKIDALKKTQSTTKALASHLKENVKDTAKHCEDAEKSLKEVVDAMALIESNVAEAKKYDEEYTGLGVEKDLEKLDEAANEAISKRDEAVKERKNTCDSSAQLLNTVSEVEKITAEAEAALTGLESTFSDEIFEQVKQKVENTNKEVRKLLEITRQAEGHIFVMSNKVNIAATTLRNMQKYTIEPTLLVVKTAYDKCNAEFNSKRNSGDASDSSDSGEDEIRRPQCQKRNKESSSSKKSEDKENPTNSKKSEEKESNTTQPTEKNRGDTKRGGQNDGAARHAVLKNAFFVCLFVAGLSLLTTA